MSSQSIGSKDVRERMRSKDKILVCVPKRIKYSCMEARLVYTHPPLRQKYALTQLRHASRAMYHDDTPTDYPYHPFSTASPCYPSNRSLSRNFLRNNPLITHPSVSGCHDETAGFLPAGKKFEFSRMCRGFL